MYVIRPHGVSRSRSHWARGTHSSGVRFWNFTASAPARQAPSISFFATSSRPLWFIPISATPKNRPAPPPPPAPPRPPGPGGRSCSPPAGGQRPQAQDPFGERADRAESAAHPAAVVHGVQPLGHGVRGRRGQATGGELLEQPQVVDVVSDVREALVREP